ncbi:MAG: Bug family tripartite tricarboxylate transporter substrate binding protein [Hydrogenophaga sp.]|jgi:tripartite-type tricarboxylate transporter receptor subunit TctC|uniref:Bug family tripartite tricarboxylate transporter substrate binding protein n=1 Tax=Hydrogenophaga sp. TaxID=1904254 RepID=UPI001D4AE8F5|nr:tripartite tricarboxylate transporter substrate binding protein [Hydrogenophaga sp.]MBW0172341.1 tripartite tricarboxylate transporter substrate binding protein [Hydrogenophaga sp.]MBW0182712.1 tripartite tricarboxylate transporter substrate binding protein [Hydrogenophaga sp.]
MALPTSLISRRQLVLATAASLASLPTWAQAPKTVKLVVPFPPGGSTDILARAIGARLATQMGITVVIENKGGAAGSVGAGEVARMAPDGATLMMGHIGTLAINPSIYPKLPYDPVKSFAPLALVARVPNVLVVNEKFPATDFKGFIAKAKAEPGRLNYASGGNGSAAHITFEYLKQQTGIFMPHIPYRGAAPAVSDVLGGQVEAIFTGSPALIAHIRGGKLRPLAVSSPKRMPALPDVPTVAESGYPGFDADQWYGIVAPAGLPAPLVALYNSEINKALASPEVARALAIEGAEPTPTTPQAFAQLIASEIPRWGQVIKRGNVKAD